MSADAGTYTDYPSLVLELPPLVRKQRRLEGQIAEVAPIVEDEKAVRKQIDALLVGAGVGKGESVSCLGYDVTHVERAGSTRINRDLLIAKLTSAGLSMPRVIEIVAASTEIGDVTTWATVKPAKGAKVRT